MNEKKLSTLLVTYRWYNYFFLLYTVYRFAQFIRSECIYWRPCCCSQKFMQSHIITMFGLLQFVAVYAVETECCETYLKMEITTYNNWIKLYQKMNAFIWLLMLISLQFSVNFLKWKQNIILCQRERERMKMFFLIQIVLFSKTNLTKMKTDTNAAESSQIYKIGINECETQQQKVDQ